MNRPELKNISIKKEMEWEEIFKKEFFRYRDFANELEKYCDELEKENIKLKKALDKACDILVEDLNACCEQEVFAASLTALLKECGVECKQCWKEWLIKDE